MNSALFRVAKIPIFIGILFFSLEANLWARGQSDRGGKENTAPTEAPGEGTGAEDPAVPEGEGGVSPEEGKAPEAKPEMTAEEAAAAAIAAAAAARNAEILDLDIRTSTLSELAAWCRSLGLSEGGDRAALGNRLREYFKFGKPPAGGRDAESQGGSSPKVITIESARSSEYFTLDVTNEEYARLRGDVVVSLKDRDSVHRISAWEILYNRSRNLMSASGGVEYIKESGDTTETFRGESITVDLDNWASIFMDGVSERSVSGSSTTYRFSGKVISRSSEEATVLSRATISNGANPEALWSLSASKIWLLPGSDFAVLNGVLKVGEIPVLYIPAFFFPGDEIIFHPVLGYRSREGTFLQTTTYILGRPQSSSSSESSLSKILGNSTDMEKTRHGIFLKSTGKKSRNPNTTRLSVLLDAYTNLGAYLGTELALPKKGIFNDYKLSLGLGITRDVQLMENNTTYTPFPNYDGTSNWNSSRIGGRDLPFRFRMTNAGSLGGKYGSFSWDLPYYSDPYVNRDFMDRSEEMNYAEMLRQGGSILEAEDALTKNILGSYQWRLSASSRPSLPALNPYISSLSVSSLTSFVQFGYRSSKALANSVSPNKIFFYPEKFTIYSISAGISGTPLNIGGGQRQAKQSGTPSPAADGEPPPDPFKGLGTPNAPWPLTRNENTKDGDPTALHPPVLSQRFDLPLSGGPRFSIAYQLSPTSATELQFRSNSAHWTEVEDIDWSDVSSLLTNVRTDGSTTFSLSDVNSIISNSLRFSGAVSWQGYGLINEEAEEYDTELERNAARVRARGQTTFTSSAEFISTLRPFYLSSVWGGTNFQYSVKGLIARSEFKTNSGPDGNPIPNPSVDDTSWDILFGKWDKENLDSHRAAANFSASLMNKSQDLSFTMDLPPEDSLFTGDAAMRIWKSETRFSGRIRGKSELEKAEETGAPTAGIDTKNKTVTYRELFEDPFYEPLRLTETLRFNSSFTASQNVVYNPEEEEFDSMSSNLSFYGLTASFTSRYALTSTFDPTGGWHWVQSADKSFQPQEFKLRYNRTFKKGQLWDKRLSLSLGLDTALAYDFQRFTNSNFSFDLKFTLGIARFLDISLGTTSENTVIYRYFRDIPLFDVPSDLPRIGETNPFIDLLNSFRFDDEDLRKLSGFKLKSLKLSLLHHLGDWDARLGMSLTPYLTPYSSTGGREYKFNTEVSFTVQWLPVSEIKTEIFRNKDRFEFK
ncbi:hypothetical protein FACS1894137_01020 [Spirochaetia bacterium]|nr:hypothetical protein FACS1894137_01020 [Spirochaetia bacterium]